MAMRWRGFDLRMVKDPALRSQLSKVDDFLKQINQTVASIINTTTVVSSPTLNFGSPVALGSALSDGTSTKASRADHVHVFPPTVRSTANASTLTLTDDATNQIFAGSLGSLTLRSTDQFNVTAQGTTSPNIRFTTAGGLTSGNTYQFNNATTAQGDASFEGHWRLGHPLGGIQSQNVLHINRSITDDSRTALAVITANSTIAGNITSGTYAATHRGFSSTFTFNPTTMPATGNKTLRGADFGVSINGAATASITTVQASKYTINDLGFVGAIATAEGSDISFSGAFAGGITAVYGVRASSIPVGTDRWSFWGSNKIQCDASDFIAAASGKGYIDKDSQSSSAGGGGTARYWRMLTDASATGVAGDVTIAIDSAGVITGTRAGGATGTVLLKLIDVGTSLPTS